MAITGGGPNPSFLDRISSGVRALVDAFRPAPAPVPADPAAAVRAGMGAALSQMDRLYRAQASGGQAPPVVFGAGYPVALDPVLQNDQDQQRIWSSEEAKYGRATTTFGLTPQSYGTYSATDLTLERLADIHRETDQQGILHRKADLDFAVNRRDGHLKACQRQRIGPLYRSRLEVAPADAPASLRPLAWALAAICRSILDRIQGLQKAEEDLGSAAAHGYAGLEVVWTTPQDLTVPISSRRSCTIRQVRRVSSLEWIHPRDFRWHPIRRTMALDAGGQRYIDPFVGPDGTPTHKLIFHGTEGVGDPHQRGYDFAAAPLHLLKFQGLARWSVMLELFGINTPYITWNEEGYATEDDIQAAIQFLALYGRGRPAFLPRKVGELHQTETPQGVDARGQHAAILGVVNAELSKLVMGQTLSAEVGGSGSYALANTMADSKEEVQVIDAALAADTWTHQLLVFIIDENLPQICRALGATPAQIQAVRPRAYRVVDRGLTPDKLMSLYIQASSPAPAGLGMRLDLARVAQQLAIPVAQDEPQDEGDKPKTDEESDAPQPPSITLTPPTLPPS